jgi:predicted nucleic acid-binding Zn ribbon protein
VSWIGGIRKDKNTAVGINLITGSGEQSLTACVNVVKRAQASGRPVRILYISDFDPAGASMPVAVARKIEFRLYQEQLSGVLDIQVRPILLSHDQCIEYQLPRIPIKDTESRAEKFEERFGEGATELDALEALQPGEFERILTQEIDRYYDDDLEDRISTVADEVQSDLDDVNEKARERHAKAIATLEAEQKKLAAAIKAFETKAKPILRKIEQDLEAEAPDVDYYDWPEPDEGDEDDDPLFDSTREFVEQVDRYKEHQGKPITGAWHEKVCQQCGEAFTAKTPNAGFCSKNCWSAFDYALRKAKYDKVCKECGTAFTAGHADAEFCSKKCGNRFGMRQARLKAKAKS